MQNQNQAGHFNVVQYQNDIRFFQHIDLNNGEEANRRAIRHFIMDKFQVEVQSFDLCFDPYKNIQNACFGPNVKPYCMTTGKLILDPFLTIQRCFEVARAHLERIRPIAGSGYDHYLVLSAWPKNNQILNNQAVPCVEYQVKEEGQKRRKQ